MERHPEKAHFQCILWHLLLVVKLALAVVLAAHQISAICWHMGAFFPSTRPRQALEISSQCPFRKLPTHLLCDRVSSVLADRPWPLFQSSAFPLSCTPPQVRVRTAVRIWTVVPVPVAMWSVGTTNDKEKSILHHIAERMGTHMNSRHSVWKYLYFQRSARRCLALTTNSWVREELKSSYNGRNINSERQSLAYSQMVRNSDLNL